MTRHAQSLEAGSRTNVQHDALWRKRWMDGWAWSAWCRTVVLLGSAPNWWSVYSEMEISPRDGSGAELPVQRWVHPPPS